jgi:hypothetical protein
VGGKGHKFSAINKLNKTFQLQCKYICLKKAFLQPLMIKRFCLLAFLLSLTTFVNAQEVRGSFVKTDLFSIEREKLFDDGTLRYRIAVDADEIIAFNSCNAPVVFFLNSEGRIIDEVKLPYEGCLRNMEFDEFDNLMMMNNEETKIFKYVRRTKKVEEIPYTKPEDWYNNLNHFFRFFEIASIPTYYNNPTYYQDFYKTRFPYSYNLWLNYQDGFIYQFAYNFIKKVGNRKTYLALKKSDLWFSDRLTNKCKPLLIDLEKETTVYFDRALTIYHENFKTGVINTWPCVEGTQEAAQLDYATNIKQKKIWGISGFDKKNVTFSVWNIR